MIGRALLQQADAARHGRAFPRCGRRHRLPVILHDVPSRTVKGLADETLLELADLAAVCGIARRRRRRRAGLARLRSRLPRAFRMLTGDDTTSLAWLAAGGDGCISAVANVAPDLYVAASPALPRRPAVPGARAASAAGTARDPAGARASWPP